ncbi:MAG: DNA repair protein RecN [Acidobacteriaceae bacterium]
MLTQLRVENYAVIDQLTVEFGAGLNLLTGETGAGKSILIDALSLLLGEKASSEMVRHGSLKAVVSAVFVLQGAAKSVAAVLESNGIDADDPEQLIIRREVLASGKGRVFINNQAATVSALRQIAPEIAFIHSQNETLAHFDGEERRKLLDGFASIDTARCAELFAKWRALRERIRELEQGEQERLRMVDVWMFQRNEIEAAKLEPGEDERLETERRILQNAEKLYAAAMAAYEVLYEEDGSAAASVAVALKHLEELARYDASFTGGAQSLAAARAAIEDVSLTARHYAEAIDASPERLLAVEDRLAAIHLLKRKYGKDVLEIMAYGEELSRKLNEIENREEALAELQQELAAVAAEYLKEAQRLSKQRADGARKLAATVERQVNDLAMKARFEIRVEADESDAAWRSHGIDEVGYLIATNPGEPLMPLEEIASGGELSRVMLALKASVFEVGASKRKTNGALASTSPLRTLVFDEIDTGIGGRAAEAVGQKLKQLAHTHQVLCVTHLPQIASFADQHFVIEKNEAAGRTRTGVRPIKGRERTEEIARMLSGAKLTEASIKNAEQMLKANA